MHYITLPYRTADDINAANVRVGAMRNKYNHVQVVSVNALEILVEYST